jgi:hypothetical protein
MDIRISLRAAACAFGTLCLWAVPTAEAATVNVNYALSGTIAGDPTNPPVITSATGALVPLGSVTWTGLQFPNPATGEDNGTFTGVSTGNLVGRTFSTSGSGTLNTTPEPGSIGLLALGLLCLVGCSKQGLRSWRIRSR